MWASSGSGGVLCRFDGERWKPYAPEEIPQVSGDVAGVPMRDGAVWFYDFRAEKVLRFDPTSTQWTVYTDTPPFVGQVTTILKAEDGSLWVVGQHRGRSGAARFDGTRWRVFLVEDGLAGENIYTGYAADNGDGLPITKGFAELLGGTIGVQGEVRAFLILGRTCSPHL